MGEAPTAVSSLCGGLSRFSKHAFGARRVISADSKGTFGASSVESGLLGQKVRTSSHLVICQGMALDTLQARGRLLALFERYGALLTDHQRDVVGLHLRSDWSLAEIASHQGTSRAAVHDIVRRSTLALQSYEKRLGLLAESARNRRALAALEKELDGLQRRLSKLEASV